MKHDNLSIRLEPRTDRAGRKFFVGKLKFPGNLKFNKGVSFIVFTSEEGVEELQIAVDSGEDKKHTKKMEFKTEIIPIHIKQSE